MGQCAVQSWQLQQAELAGANLLLGLCEPKHRHALEQGLPAAAETQDSCYSCFHHAAASAPAPAASGWLPGPTQNAMLAHDTPCEYNHAKRVTHCDMG